MGRRGPSWKRWPARFCPAPSSSGPGTALSWNPYFQAADLFVLPGTGGLAVQQAMSFGLPVIVAEGDGTQIDLVRAENGWTVAPGRLDALASCLAEALRDPARLRRMGQESYRIVHDEVNLERMVEVFTEVCRICVVM